MAPPAARSACLRPASWPWTQRPLTLAQASFSRTAVLSGSTCLANLRLLMVYSCPQYTLWGAQSLSSGEAQTLRPPGWAYRARARSSQ